MTSVERPLRIDGYKLEALDDEFLLYHPAQTRAIYMNQTAMLLWGLCDGRSVDDIIQQLSEAYPDASATMAEDVRATLTQFVEFGAIKSS